MVSRVKRDFKFDDAFHPMCYFKLVHGSMQRVAFQKCQSAWKQILCVGS